MGSDWGQRADDLNASNDNYLLHIFHLLWRSLLILIGKVLLTYANLLLRAEIFSARDNYIGFFRYDFPIETMQHHDCIHRAKRITYPLESKDFWKQFRSFCSYEESVGINLPEAIIIIITMMVGERVELQCDAPSIGWFKFKKVWNFNVLYLSYNPYDTNKVLSDFQWWFKGVPKTVQIFMKLLWRS